MSNSLYWERRFQAEPETGSSAPWNETVSVVVDGADRHGARNVQIPRRASPRPDSANGAATSANRQWSQALFLASGACIVRVSGGGTPKTEPLNCLDDQTHKQGNGLLATRFRYAADHCSDIA